MNVCSGFLIESGSASTPPEALPPGTPICGEGSSGRIGPFPGSGSCGVVFTSSGAFSRSGASPAVLGFAGSGAAIPAGGSPAGVAFALGAGDAAGTLDEGTVVITGSTGFAPAAPASVAFVPASVALVLASAALVPASAALPPASAALVPASAALVPASAAFGATSAAALTTALPAAPTADTTPSFKNLWQFFIIVSANLEKSRSEISLSDSLSSIRSNTHALVYDSVNTPLEK